jgi:hypothetical protein
MVKVVSKIASDAYSLDLTFSAKILVQAFQKAKEFRDKRDARFALYVIAMHIMRLDQCERAFEIISGLEEPRPQSAGYFRLAEYLFKKSGSQH